MTKLLTYKSTIFTITGAIITYSLSKNYIDGDMANLLSTILIAIGGSVNVATNNLLSKKNK